MAFRSLYLLDICIGVNQRRSPPENPTVGSSTSLAGGNTKAAVSRHRYLQCAHRINMTLLSLSVAKLSSPLRSMGLTDSLPSITPFNVGASLLCIGGLTIFPTLLGRALRNYVLVPKLTFLGDLPRLGRAREGGKLPGSAVVCGGRYGCFS